VDPPSRFGNDRRGYLQLTSNLNFTKPLCAVLENRHATASIVAMKENEVMDVKSEEPLGVSSEISQPSGVGSGPISALPTPRPAKVSDGPVDVVEHHIVGGPMDDLQDVSQNKEEVKGDTNEAVRDASHGVVEVGVQTIADYILGLQSTLNQSTVEPSAAEITQNVLSSGPAGAGAGEGEDGSVVGSLDVRFAKFQSLSRENVDVCRSTRMRQTLHLGI
jgi:hypothetical protein